MAKTDLQFGPFGSHGVSLAKDEQAQCLVLRIPYGPDALSIAQPSKTGKTRLVANTGGHVPVPGTGIKLSVMATIPTHNTAPGPVPASADPD